MKISLRERDGVTILDCSGKLSVDDGDEKLREAVDALVAGGETMIILNLRGVVSMDSSGLGELLASKKSCDARDAQIKLLDVNQKVGKILTMTRLVGIFEIFEDERSALASF